MKLAVVICGRIGSGKSTAVDFVAAEFGFNPNPPNRVVVALERDLPGMERGSTRRISGGRGQ